MGRRQAQVWKKQQDLTNLAENITDIDILQEKLRVKIALQMMRKAHVDGSAADRKRIKLQKFVAGDIHVFEKNPPPHPHHPKKKKTKKFHDDENDQKPVKVDEYLEMEPFRVKTFEEIMKNAKESYLIKKDKNKLEQEAFKHGQLRPICPALIEELKKERIEKYKEDRKQRRALPRMKPKRLLEELAQRRGSTLNEISSSLEGTSTTHNEGSYFSESLQKASREPSTFKIAEESLESIRDDDEEEQKNWREHIKQQKPNSLLLSYARPSPITIDFNYEKEAGGKENMNNLDQASAFLAAAGGGEHQGMMRRSRETFIIPQARLASFNRPLSANGAIQAPRNQSISEGDFLKDDSWMKEAVDKAAASFHQAMNEQVSQNELIKPRPYSANPSLRESARGIGGSAIARTGSNDYMRRSVSFIADNNGTNLRPSSPKANHASSSFLKPRTPSFVMRTSTFDEDEQIQKAVKKRDSQIQEKEEKLMKKIYDRDRLAETKLQFQLKQERQKAWLVFLILQQRVHFLKNILMKFRQEKAWAKTNSKIKKALRVIKSWWKREAVILKLKRNPKVKATLGRFFAHQVFRMNYRKKKRSANLILTFLRESSVISESMRKIYAFRQDVIKIQRYVRSWFDAQQYRVRLLWIAGERIARDTAKQERIAKLKNEKSSMKALQTLSGFADSVIEINSVRKKLSKVLEHQDEARKNREDLYYEVLKVETKISQQEHLKSRDPSPSALVNGRSNNNTNKSQTQQQSGSYQHHLQAVMKKDPRGRSRPQSANAIYSNPTMSSSNVQLTGSNNLQASISSSSYDLNSRKLSNPVPSGAVPINSNGLVNPLSSSTNNLPYTASSRRVMSSSNANFGTRTLTSNPSNYASAYQMRGRRGGRMGDIGANTVFLGLSDRCGSDPSMQAWYRRIRNTPNGLKLFDTLRTILTHQRRRHLIRLNAQQTRRKICPVEIEELQQFLKDPSDFTLSHNISITIGGIDQTQAIAIDHKSSPFLLLTQGGLEQVEMVVKLNRNIRF